MRFDIARSRRALAALALVATAAAVPLLGQSQEPVDLQAIYKIKDEGLQRSKVMEITSYLTDVYGPRLTGSPNIRTRRRVGRQGDAGRGGSPTRSSNRGDRSDGAGPTIASSRT